MGQVAKVVGLFIYPVKSCAGFGVNTMEVDTLGPRWDRRWMLVDGNGLFVSQRKYSTMASIKTSISRTALSLHIPGFDECEVGFEAAEQGEKVPVRIWKDDVMARDCGHDVNERLSEFLGASVRLVFTTPGEPRVRNKDVEFRMGFADSRPFLLTNMASLTDLNRRANAQIPMSRFRPNIVVENDTAFSEDSWGPIRIGDVEFHHSAACDRCVIVTIDQNTGKRAGAEPLKTLKTYRVSDGTVLFGMRLVHSNTGKISMGDSVLRF